MGNEVVNNLDELYNLSDEEALEQIASGNINPVSDEEEEEEIIDQEDNPEEEQEEGTEEEEDTPEEEEEQNESDNEAEEIAPPQPLEVASGTKKDTKNKKQDKGSDEPITTESVNDEAVNFMKQLTGEFKASGKSYQIKDPDDIMRLMQQGVDYSKKMQEFKPYKNIIATLEENNISIKDIPYLIDLNNGDKQAIKKLIKDNEYDAYADEDADDAKGYTPKTVQVNADVQETKKFISGLQQSSDPIVKANIDDFNGNINDFNDEGIQYLSNNPDDVKALWQQQTDGVFNQVMGEVRNYLALNPNNKDSTFKIYKEMLVALGNAQLLVTQQPNTEEEPAPVAPVAPVTPSNRQKVSANTGVRKTKRAVKTQSTDTSSMSDDEFLKFMNSK